MRKVMILLLAICLSVSALVFSGCQSNGEAQSTESYCFVTFKDWDGRLLQINRCVVGSGANAPVAPTRAEDEDYAYTFTGWDKPLDSFEQDTEVTAVYSPTYLCKIYFSLDDRIYYSAKYTLVKTVPIPKEIGREFDGWYTDLNYSQKVTDSLLNSLLLYNDVTFYGKWGEPAKPPEKEIPIPIE